MKSAKTETANFPGKCKHITDAYCQIIEKLYREGNSVVQITDWLGFHRSFVYRELKRGQVSYLGS